MLSEWYFIIQLAIGIVFLISVAGKLRNPRAFARGVAEYQIIPGSIVIPVTILIIGLEGWLSLAHIAAWKPTIALPIGLTTFAIFALAVGINLIRGRALPCHCFGGSADEAISSRTLVRLFLLASSEAFLIMVYRRTTLIQQSISVTELPLAVFWAVFLLIAGAWLLNLGDLKRLIMPAEGASSDSRSRIVNQLE
jgi:hypothetical protein